MGVPARHASKARRTSHRAIPRNAGYRGIGPEPYLNGRSQGELGLSQAGGTPEDALKDGHIRGRSRKFMKHPG
jgi:hypothetical protein